jgi:hypothetical protein
MSLEGPMVAGEGKPTADDGRARLRAADVDREQVAGILGTAFTEGRLTKDEYDERLEGAWSSRTYGELEQLLADLPVRANFDDPAAGSAELVPAGKTNGYAVASLVCGLSQFLVGPLAAIPAIAFGHAARNQIKQTGEQGAGLALAGLILGWGAAAFSLILMIAFVAATARMNTFQGP